MRRAGCWAFVAALVAVVAAPGVAQERERGRRYADPAAVLAAELASTRLGQEKGALAAFRKLGDPAAELFVPQRVGAADWLKRHAGPPLATRRTAHAVWASCDGAIVVTSGRWRAGGGDGAASGTYATVWRRQEKGGYRWLLDMDLAAPASADAPEMIPARVADCEGERLAADAAGTDDGSRTGVSRDGSLRWTTTVDADGARRFTLDMRKDGKPEQVLDIAVAAPPAG